VRVAAARLDALVAQGGELLLARRRAARRQEDVAALLGTMGRCLAEWRHLDRPRDLPRRAALATERTSLALKKLSRDLERLARDMAADHHALDRAAAPLEEEIRRVRMRPFAEACEGLARAVRDLGLAAGKEIDLVVEGEDVELDRAILAGLRDPLLHLVRNAVDHGIEPPAERRARGKPSRGRITIAAALAREGVEVTVADDGRGIDLAAVRDQAQRRGPEVPGDDRELARLVFSPGFSTSPLVTELSGRGIGLDVVRHAVEGLQGRVDLAFEPGAGTRFVLGVPLTLSTTRVLFVAVAGQTYALPSVHVRGLLRAGADDLGSVEGREVLLGSATPIPVVSLAEVLGLPSREPARVGGKVLLVLLGAGERSIACAVDELASEQDVVIKSLGRRLQRVPRIAGATVLPTGRIALVLAAAEVVDAALGLEPARPLVPALTESPAVARKRLLVVDDSITTRTLERTILEAAGYDVVTAADGAEAWHALHEITVDLVVADVEMPRMDGFALTEAIRGSKRHRDLPVVLVTALESERDKARGLEAGADAYLPKSTFDQSRLLQAVAQLV
jgi:two-component system chemotaxis sensor kinase CheA